MSALNKNDFMIVSMARSGTSFLRNIINSVEGYHCLGEIFRKHGDSLEDLSRLLACTESEILKRKGQSKAEFWRQLRGSPRRSGYLIGAKLFYSHVDWDDALWQDIRSLNVIHLIRGNALELFVSIALANRTNIWKSDDYDRRYDAGSIVVSVKELLDFKAKRSQNVRNVRERYASSRYVEIFYEDLVESGGPERFLQVALGARGEWGSKIKKQRRRPLEEIVANYSEVVEFDYVERPSSDSGLSPFGS